MKFLIIIGSFIFWPQSNSYSQKFDLVWRLGSSEVDQPQTKSGGVLLDFGTTPPTQTIFQNKMVLTSCGTTTCDKNGKPAFYSNGCEVWNTDGTKLVGGDSINYPGIMFKGTCQKNTDYFIRYQGILTLPNPKGNNTFYMFHQWIEGDGTPGMKLLHSFIDMNHKNGQGRVVYKNEILVADTLCEGLSAVRHGNGRDWWLYSGTSSGSANSNVYLFLLDTTGVHGPVIVNNLGNWTLHPYFTNFQTGGSVFSPNGMKFARVSQTAGIQIADFDRCSGTFSCPVNIPWPFYTDGLSTIDFEGDSTFISGCGVAFSPNSRFLYVTSGERLYQFDTWVKDIVKSRVLVGEYDKGYVCPYFAVTLFQPQLAPDGKIYISATNGVACLSVINDPDKKGAACNFVPHGLELLRSNGFSLTIYPNFRLYDWQNSPCDTLILEELGEKTNSSYATSLKVVPNPASDIAQIWVPADCSDPVVRVHEVTGKLMCDFGHVAAGNTLELDVTDWPSGTYFISLVSGKKVIEVVRMVVLFH